MANNPIDLEEEINTLESIKQLRKLPSITAVTPADIRLYAGVLRFLLIDNGGALLKSSSKWKVKLSFEVTDTKPLVREAQNGHISAFSSSMVPIFGHNSGSFMYSKDPSNRVAPAFDHDKKVNLNLESLLKQVVIFSELEFVTRGDVLRYIAHKAGALHWDRDGDERKARNHLPETKIRALESIRKGIKLSCHDGHTVFHMPKIDPDVKDEFRYNPEQIDMAHLEFYALASVICSSPSVQELVHTMEIHIKELSA